MKPGWPDTGCRSPWERSGEHRRCWGSRSRRGSYILDNWSISNLTVNPSADQAAAQRVLKAAKDIYLFMDNAVNGHLHIAALGFRRDQDGKLSLLSAHPAQNITVREGETAEVTFDNDPYGELRVEKSAGSQVPAPGRDRE